MKKIFSIFIALAALTCCTKPVVFSIPDAQKSYEFAAEGATEFATISTTDFKVACDADWIFTQIYSGSSSHNLRITVYKNGKAAERSAEIVLTPDDGSGAQTIKISQAGADPYIKLASQTVSLGMDDETFTLGVYANTEFSVETPDWIKYEEDMTEFADSCTLNFSILGEVESGETRSGYINISGQGASAKAYVEQVGARWETVTICWGVEDIQYIWKAFNKSTAAITQATISSADFSAYPRIKAYSPGGFIYTNEEGADLYVVMSADAQFKINKAGSKTSTGNINRDGENVERMQMNKATSGVGENSFMFLAPRSGVLEVEAAAPNGGDKKPQILVDDNLIDDTFAAPYAIPAAVTEIPITVTSSDGAYVRIFGTNGAINYFRITYTYERPVLK